MWVFAVFAGLIFMIGASVFSFLDVIIYRVPKKLSFIRGRSFCPACGHTLGMLSLIPIAGYLGNGGKCRYCGSKIPVSELIGELAGGALFVALCLFCGLFDIRTFSLAAFLEAAIDFAFFCTLYIVSAVDLKTYEIPDGFVIAVAAVGIMSFFTNPELRLYERLLGAVSASSLLFIVTLAVKDAFGGGDIKFMAAAGLFLGWKLCLFALFAAILTAGIYGIWLMAEDKIKSGGGIKGKRIAFGPFLSVGCAVAVFFGNGAIDWYVSFFK